MMVKDVVEQICKAGGFIRGSKEADIIHTAVTNVYGSEYKSVSGSAMRYGSQVERELYNQDSRVANRAVQHVRTVMNNLK